MKTIILLSSLAAYLIFLYVTHKTVTLYCLSYWISKLFNVQFCVYQQLYCYPNCHYYQFKKNNQLMNFIYIYIKQWWSVTGVRLIPYPYEYEKARFLICIMFRELKKALVIFQSNCLSSIFDRYFIYEMDFFTVPYFT